MISQKKIFLLEDDSTLGESLYSRLSQDYQVLWAQNVQQSKELVNNNKFDLAILDIGLPDGNGFEVAEELKKKSSCLFLFLTAQADAESRLKGFELGAEEFIPKPFFLKELLLRVKHVLDIHTPKQEVQLSDRTIQFADMSIHHHQGAIEYPPLTDMKVLKLLVERSPQAVSRDQIFDHIWGEEKTPNYRTVDNIIVRLRQILGDDGEQHIRSVRSIGYVWVEVGGKLDE